MKKFIVIVIAIISMFSCLGCNSASQGKNSSKTEMNAEVNEKKSIAVIQNAMGCSEQSAKKYYEKLKAVEFVPIIKMDFSDSRNVQNNGDIVTTWNVVCGNGGYSATIS